MEPNEINLADFWPYFTDDLQWIICFQFWPIPENAHFSLQKFIKIRSVLWKYTFKFEQIIEYLFFQQKFF